MMKRISAGVILLILIIFTSGCAPGKAPAAGEEPADATTIVPAAAERADASTTVPAAAERADASTAVPAAAEKEDASAIVPAACERTEAQELPGDSGDEDDPWETEDDDSCDDRSEPERDDENVFPDEGEERPDRGENEEQTELHTHNWVAQTQVIHHEETGHYETVQTGTKTVVDEEAWEEPVYENRPVCSACGYEAESVEEMNDHLDCHYDPELGYIDAGYSVEEIVVDTIHHPEKTHGEPVCEEQWIVDSEAWDEEVVTGYRCSICGEEK